MDAEEKKLTTICLKYMKDCVFENNYVRGVIDGENNLNSFIKEFEAGTHLSFSTVKSEQRKENCKRYLSQGKLKKYINAVM